MAPPRDTSREACLAAIGEGRVPFVICWRYAPFARVEVVGERWTLRTLRLDEARADEAARQASAAGQPFRPEQFWAVSLVPAAGLRGEAASAARLPGTFEEPAETVYTAPTPEALAGEVARGPWPPRRGAWAALLAAFSRRG